LVIQIFSVTVLFLHETGAQYYSKEASAVT